MADSTEPQVKPQIAGDSLPQEQGAAQRQRMQTAADQPRPGIPGGGANPVRYRQPPKPAGPQLWAVVITIGGLYYLWTRVLGKSLPSFAQRGKTSGGGGGGRVSNSNRQAEIQAARERQQQRLETAARAREMVIQAKDRNLRERTNATSSGNGASAPSSSSSGGLSINQQAALLKAQQAQKQKQTELEQKKKKQRQLYLKQKALKEKEEEKRKKDEQLGPGWEYRQDPTAATAQGSMNHMDPQAGASGGGYKAAKKCAPRGGG